MSEHRVDSAIPLPPDVGAGPMPTPAEDVSATAPVAQGRLIDRDETYYALVWRRFRRSVVGMVGLVLVVLLLVMAVFADFFAPMEPKEQGTSLLGAGRADVHRAGRLLLADPEDLSDRRQRSTRPDHLPADPSAPDMEHPISLGFFVKGYSYKIFWLIPADIHFFGAADGVPVHFLGTDKLGRDILSRGIIGSRISLTIALVVVSITTMVGTSLGITSGYIGGRFNSWLQRFVEVILAFPQLPSIWR